MLSKYKWYRRLFNEVWFSPDRSRSNWIKLNNVHVSDLFEKHTDVQDYRNLSILERIGVVK